MLPLFNDNMHIAIHLADNKFCITALITDAAERIVIFIFFHAAKTIFH